MINTVNSDKQKYKYHDPLNRPIPVLMSYSSEIGTAISEIAPKLGAALWAPTFMYLGADIYDKYKNDKDNYNPSAKRALKRAVFQGLTSLIAMPAIIFAGQCVVSPLGRIDKSGISGNAKDAIYRHTKNVIEQAHGTSLDSYEHFKDTIIATLNNKINTKKNEKHTINIFKYIYNKIFTKRYVLLNNDKNKIDIFAKKNAKRTFEIMKSLKEGDEKHVPRKIYRKYTTLLPAMNEMYKEGDYSYLATRNALKEYQNSLIFRNKLLKTLGGFGALILLTNPVNNFVEKQIMKKYINPGIDQISSGFVNQSKIKNIFNTMHMTKVNSVQQNGLTSNLLARLKIQHELKSKAAVSQ